MRREGGARRYRRRTLQIRRWLALKVGEKFVRWVGQLEKEVGRKIFSGGGSIGPLRGGRKNVSQKEKQRSRRKSAAPPLAMIFYRSPRLLRLCVV